MTQVKTVNTELLCATVNEFCLILTLLRNILLLFLAWGLKLVVAILDTQSENPILLGCIELVVCRMQILDIQEL